MQHILADGVCLNCNVGDHATCDFALRREAGLCGCMSDRHAQAEASEVQEAAQAKQEGGTS